jgi:two-component system, NtrC family, sensor kinase
MHIEESASDEFEMRVSASCAQVFVNQAQLKGTHHDLEIIYHCRGAVEAALSVNGLGIWDWNLITNQTYYDPQWKLILGYEVLDIENHHQSFESLVNPADLPRVMSVLSDYLEGRSLSYEVEFRMKTKSGDWKWILDKGQVFERDEFGKPVRMAGTHKDITSEVNKRQLVQENIEETTQQLKKLEEDLYGLQQQLLKNQRLANLGQLVTAITNEVINPVNFIYGNLHTANQYAENLINLLELYQIYYPQPAEEIKQKIQKLNLDYTKTDFLKLLWSMRAGSERIREIVTALQNFSSAENNQFKKTDLNQALNNVLRILNHRLKETPSKAAIEVITNLADLPSVECCPGQINQVFMNLLTNAIDALEDKMKVDYSFLPKICISTEIMTSHLSLVSSQENSRPQKKHKILIKISDNGQGILPHIKRHIFEPFFTTKLPSQGRGLGLSISKEIIVEKHQGKIKCYSQPGEGSEFVIEINTRLIANC